MDVRIARGMALLLGSFVSLSCIPEGEATPDAGTKAAALPPIATTSRPVAAAPEVPAITAPFEDTFDRPGLGTDWTALSPAWRIRDGRLCGQGARNRGVWLRRSIPVNARIEFDATSDSPDGDIKAELWGDGMTGATGTSYTNASSYLVVLGGWKNTLHVLAKRDEHADDRLEIEIDNTADDERLRAVAPGQPYHFQIERRDGKTLEWSVNGEIYFKFSDPEPLAGEGHDRIGFNDWDVPVCFDNLKITPL